MVDTVNPASANQPKNADQLEQSIEEWRISALRTIDKRLALYDSKPTGQNAPPATSSASPHTRYSGSHRALDVVEVLEQILSYTSPRTHYKAWNVSRRWREIVVHMLDTQYHAPYPCVAVEHGDTIPPNMKRLSPSEDEVAQLQAQIDIDSMIEHRLRLGWTDLFITARFTQADTLPQQMLTAVHTSIHSEFESHELRSFYSTSDGSRWMDLSQFEVNPYFTDLFGDCFQEFKGSYYITIKPHIQDYLRNLASSTGPSREQLIQDMFLTRPPCKVLRIYATMKSREGLQVVGSVHQTDGVRIGDLLPQLQQHCSTATELWYTRSQLLRTEIVGHTDLENSHRAWICPGFPKLVIFPEATEQLYPSSAQHICTFSQRHKEMHMREWHEDVSKPKKLLQDIWYSKTQAEIDAYIPDFLNA